MSSQKWCIAKKGCKEGRKDCKCTELVFVASPKILTGGCKALIPAEGSEALRHSRQYRSAGLFHLPSRLWDARWVTSAIKRGKDPLSMNHPSLVAMEMKREVMTQNTSKGGSGSQQSAPTRGSLLCHRVCLHHSYCLTAACADMPKLAEQKDWNWLAKETERKCRP